MTDGNDSGLERQRQSGFRSKIIKRLEREVRSGPVRAVGASQPFQSVEELVQLVGTGLPLGLAWAVCRVEIPPDAGLFPLNHRDELLDILATIRPGETVGIRETERLNKSGKIIPVSVTISPIKNAKGEITGASAIARDISRQKQEEQDRLKLITELTAAMNQVRTLTGMLPICASCKRIRDDKGYWQQVETYISKHSEVIFSHGVCPQCAEEYKRQFDLKDK